MKAITIWQPWASLIIVGAKWYETRSWQCPLKPGALLAIHAAKRQPMISGMGDEFDGHLHRVMLEARKDVYGLPRSAVLGLVQFRGNHRVEDLRQDLSRTELLFGDYSDGRYAWSVEVVDIFAEPVPATGYQGLWNWDQLQTAAPHRHQDQQRTLFAPEQPPDLREVAGSRAEGGE